MKFTNVPLSPLAVIAGGVVASVASTNEPVFPRETFPVLWMVITGFSSRSGRGAPLRAYVPPGDWRKCRRKRKRYGYQYDVLTSPCFFSFHIEVEFWSGEYCFCRSFGVSIRVTLTTLLRYALPYKGYVVVTGLADAVRRVVSVWLIQRTSKTSTNATIARSF